MSRDARSSFGMEYQEGPDHAVAEYHGNRRSLLPLYRLADDSELEIQRYMNDGQVYVAVIGESVTGFVQVVGPSPGIGEILSIAVLESSHRQGVGTRLLQAAVQHCLERGVQTLRVSTAACAFEALAFYMRFGFRVSEILTDQFTSAKGYAPDLTIEGIPLNDALVLTLAVQKHD